MGLLIKISKTDTLEQINKLLEKLEKTAPKKDKSLADYYGKMPGIFGDGLTYQKKIRNEG